MESTRFCILTTPRYRWIMVTPAVVGDQERVKRSHRLHISLTSQRVSMPLCDHYAGEEYHPWPLQGTTAIASEDACALCVRALHDQDATALRSANRMLLVHGTVTELPAAPVLPESLRAEMESMALVIQHQYQALQQQTAMTQRVAEQTIRIFQHFGLVLPDALLDLIPLSPPLLPASLPPGYVGLEPLLSYENYRGWIAAHPTDGYIVGPNTKTASHLMVHRVTCQHVINQGRSSYLYRFGVIDPARMADAFGREPDYCSDCLAGQAPR